MNCNRMGLVDIYLCVNPDGSELATNIRPSRIWDKMEENSNSTYRIHHPIKQSGVKNEWITTIHSTDYGYCGYDYTFDGIELPKGTIKKLTGINLNWNDEPYKWTE